MLEDHRLPNAYVNSLQVEEGRLHRRFPTNNREEIIEAYDGQETVAFLDVHLRGARFRGLFERAEGALVLFQCGPITRKAKIVWSRGAEFGIVFAERLSRAEVKYLSEASPEAARHYIFDLSVPS